MKIRLGFISNSSSTSFTFIFKGDFDNLCNTIPKNHFNVCYDLALSTSTGEVIQELKKHKNELKSLDERMNWYKDMLECADPEYKEYFQYQYEALLDGHKRGLDSVFEIDFGPQGEISNKVGYVIHKENGYSKFDLDIEDLLITTKENK